MLESRNAPRISRASGTGWRCVLAAVIDRDLGGFTEAKTHPTDSRTHPTTNRQHLKDLIFVINSSHF
jgi:hypothetical protein